MDIVIEPHELSGDVRAVASKSVAHRLSILAALSDATTDLDCSTTSADIEATAACMEALGARISRTRLGYRIVGRPSVIRRQLPIRQGVLNCGESGSTLRFLLPIVCALGSGGSFVGAGRLAERPLSPLYEQLVEHGMTISEQGRFPLDLTGRLQGGTFVLPGNVSSQYVSGLLMAAPLVGEPVRVVVSTPIESAPYIEMTLRALETFGVAVAENRFVRDDTSYKVYDIEPTELVAPSCLPV